MVQTVRDFVIGVGHSIKIMPVILRNRSVEWVLPNILHQVWITADDVLTKDRLMSIFKVLDVTSDVTCWSTSHALQLNRPASIVRRDIWGDGKVSVCLALIFQVTRIDVGVGHLFSASRSIG